MTLQQFINAHNNQKLDFDGAYGAQCVDLVQYWAKNLGAGAFTGNAVDLKGQTHGGFYKWIANTPTGVPKPGDIMVWGQYAPYGISQYGHTGVFVSGDVNSFNSFDQNWPTGAACHTVHHQNYGGVLGWLHPLVLDPKPAPATPAPAPAMVPLAPAPVQTTAPKPVEPAPAPQPAKDTTPAPVAVPTASQTPENANAEAAAVTRTQLTWLGQAVQWLIDKLTSLLPH